MLAVRHAKLHSLAVALACLTSSGAWAEDYWTYSYKDLEITTAAGAGRAVSLADSLARFDTALAHILQLRAGRLPTHVYELSSKQAKELLGDVRTSSYKFSGYDVTVVTSVATDSADRNWGALFGYTASLLLNDRALRSPFWFQLGVPQLFAHTEFEPRRIKTGGVAVGFAATLQNSTLIPTRILLRLQSSDPQLHEERYRALFEAESWYLAYEVFVQGKLRPEFARYLGLLRDGKSETDAFTESFKFSYEDLDKVLAHGLHEAAHVFVIDSPREAPNNQEPKHLSTAESTARLSELSRLWQRRADALRLAGEALREDPTNQRALSVIALASLEDGKFGEALGAVDKLDALSPLTTASHTASGDVLAHLAYEVTSKRASLGVEADTLSRRAKHHYEHAISLDPEYLSAWAGLAYLYSSPQEVTAAKEFATRAQPVMEKHPDNGALARALATMCSRTGQTSSAFLFAEYWRTDAMTQKDLDQAIAFIGHMQGH